WYGLWRLARGISGAALVVVGVAAALSRVATRQRPATAALVFAGIGLGIAASGSVVPWLVGYGIAPTWLALAILATVLALWSWWSVWRYLQPLPVEPGPAPAGASRLPMLAVLLVLAAYGLDAAGFVPHTLFWVDYIAHELGHGVTSGALYWLYAGCGAVTGPFVAGAMARRLGFRPALAVALAIMGMAVLLPVLSTAAPALFLSSFFVGMMIPGTVTLTSGALIELTPVARQQQVWGWATLAFALIQAVAAYGMAWWHAGLGSYVPLFALSAALLLVATLCALAAGRSSRAT